MPTAQATNDADSLDLKELLKILTEVKKAIFRFECRSIERELPENC